MFLHKGDNGTINDDFTHMFKVNRDTIPDNRLDLTHPPVVLGGVPDQGAGLKENVQHDLPPRKPTAMTDQDITALVSSRICHDLISPIGAISNGVELLTGDGTAVSPELGMIGDSVTSATDRLKCFRVAFGAAPARAELPVAEVLSAIEALFGGRSSVQCSLPGNAMSRMMAKTMLLTLLCQEKCLPMGGQTSVTADASSFRLHTVTTRVKDCEALWAVVDGHTTDTEFTPGEVQFPLLAQVLKHTGGNLLRESSEDTLSIEVTGLGG